MDAKNGAEKLEINNNNYFLGHSERLAYHIEYKKYSGGAFIYNSENDTYTFVGDGNGDYDVDKSVVYLGYAFFDDETICGATLYKAPSTTWSEGNYKLQISEISQTKKGTYQISIVDKNGNIATDFNTLITNKCTISGSRWCIRTRGAGAKPKGSGRRHRRSRGSF